jgi:large subunit ribosomal protein L6
MWGMQRTLIANMVDRRVARGFTKSLEITGVGYPRAVQGNNAAARSSATATTSSYPIPDGITVACAEADGDHHQRHRQAAGRAGGRGDPPLWRRRSPTRARACAMPGSTSFRKEGKKK